MNSVESFAQHSPCGHHYFCDGQRQQPLGLLGHFTSIDTLLQLTVGDNFIVMPMHTLDY